MSIQLGKLCSCIVQQHFGDTVRMVADDLFAAVSKTLPMIIKSTGLTKSEVCKSLAILLKFSLARFQPNKATTATEYSLDYERILMILRYPRFVHLIQTKYGHESAILTEELLRAGCQTASHVILKATSISDVKDRNTISKMREQFTELVTLNYFIRAPVAKPIESNNDLLMSEHDESRLFQMPELDLKQLLDLHEQKSTKVPDEGIHWLVNLEKFHLDFRDSIMIGSVERLIDTNAGECFKFLLQLMYDRTKAWETVSNPIPMVELKQLCEKKSPNAEMIKFLDQYVAVIESVNFVSKFGDTGGGQYTVNMKKIMEQLTWSCIDNVITEKYGSKAARIFRVIRLKKYIEQEDIQKEAMVPAKEAKQLTYKLLEENFLQIQTFRKPGGGNAGAPKSFFLFFVNQTQIVSMLLETCYKALYNSITRSTHDKTVNRRLIEKSQRLDSIVEAMKDRGESEEYIAEILETLTPPEKEILQKVKIRVKSLYSAEIGIDESIFLLKLYQQYQKK
ncbi:DNA-directed RNA polymerase III subunit RPC3 [Uranotaenia lowii]|uniref:DNA-directed RNA polymerase III subunit RPC3 n=1 Tax=Uranotaenia lowii TaxID=190385 RepID=UPI002479D79B|nr:DNA-directed RNA polymerase III subunit RPC3 [Uranotaenia lowii]XP_055587427.1 DNA-directed RNA polymerase III subunit RPC3 [Uranotaenia lowii]XP_055587509.1 DNA-directed RNA polymerase III subunit RPC3 [Uranotaenia lowii]XP_055587564.1 DNA-directed RNA polymerase III subunit RPC3 [Uranotaenia lowii]